MLLCVQAVGEQWVKPETKARRLKIILNPRAGSGYGSKKQPGGGGEEEVERAVERLRGRERV